MRFKQLDLNLLVVFSALMETRSVTRTAERLGLTQPAASASLGRVPSHGVTASALGPAAKGAKRPELQAPTVAWLFA